MNPHSRPESSQKLLSRLEARCAEVAQLADDRLVPAARQARLIRQGAAREHVASDWLLKHFEKSIGAQVDVDWTPCNSMEAARHNVEFSLFLVQMFTVGGQVKNAAEILGVVDRLHDECMYLVGFCNAVVLSRGLQTAPAAVGRRALGEKNREKVRAAAQEYVGQGQSKERVAAELASKLHLDPSTIRRMLSEMFPGRVWQDGGIDDEAR